MWLSILLPICLCIERDDSGGREIPTHISPPNEMYSYQTGIGFVCAMCNTGYRFGCIDRQDERKREDRAGTSWGKIVQIGEEKVKEKTQ